MRTLEELVATGRVEVVEDHELTGVFGKLVDFLQQGRFRKR